MSDETAEQRAQRDAEALERDFGRLVSNFTLPNTIVHGLRRRAAEQLVTWGWTYLMPGEQVTRQLPPRIRDLNLRDELAATLAGTSYSMSDDPVALAEHLVRDGWIKLGPNEKVVTPMSLDEATRIVARALLRWEEHKDAAEKQGKGPNWARDAAKKYAGEPAEVRADSSERTSGVKLAETTAQILTAFAGADRPLTRVEACDAAAGERDAFGGRLRSEWERWYVAFGNLLNQKLIERFVEPDRTDRYVLTAAGRSLHELDGVEG